MSSQKSRSVGTTLIVARIECSCANADANAFPEQRHKPMNGATAAGGTTRGDRDLSSGIVTTLVHSDKMPMTPGFGQQPRFLLTVQPTGVHFDPQAAISFPERRDRKSVV